MRRDRWRARARRAAALVLARLVQWLEPDVSQYTNALVLHAVLRVYIHRARDLEVAVRHVLVRYNDWRKLMGAAALPDPEAEVVQARIAALRSQLEHMLELTNALHDIHHRGGDNG